MGLLAKATNNPSNNIVEDELIELEDISADEIPLEEMAQPEAASPGTKQSLDEMGKALSERIGRLPHEPSTPYTALSLLKAYGAFQTGICLSLKDDVYHSYTSVGLGVKDISIPRDKVWPEENSLDQYFMIDSSLDLGIDSGQESLNYWIFPLDSLDGKEIIILGVADSAFNPKSIFTIISDSKDKFIITAKEDNPEAAKEIISTEPKDSGSGEAETGSTDSFKEKITEYNRIHPDFNCIVLEIPDSASQEDPSGFSKKISNMLSMTGTVLTLPNGRPLILLPKLLDRELIAHRLSKSLNSKLLASFEASNPDDIFSRIKSVL